MIYQAKLKEEGLSLNEAKRVGVESFLKGFKVEPAGSSWDSPHKEALEKVKEMDKDSHEYKDIMFYKAPYGSERTFLLNQDTFQKCFMYIEILQVVEDPQSLSNEVVEKIVQSVKGVATTNENLFNTRLEVHQPKCPLFTYNEFRNEDDCCTDHLNGLIEKGWRVVAICPQPNQRRPDYIMGRYNHED